MKNKSWIIVLIMGIALTISIVYSVTISRENSNSKSSTVTTKSIIEMTASTVTIRNTLTGSGEIVYQETHMEENNIISDANNLTENTSNELQAQEVPKTYQISLNIEDKDLDKAKAGQDVQISIKKDDSTLNYLGKVIEIKEDANNKSIINIEILNPDEKIEEKMIATCVVIVEEAKNVVALPIEAIQKNDENKEFVDVVQLDGSTKPVLIKTGISDDYYVEITSGLKVGDRVQIVKSSTTVQVEDN